MSKVESENNATQTDKHELLTRFGWSGVTLSQTAMVLYALSRGEKDIVSLNDEVEKDVKYTINQKKTHISPRVFLERFSAILATSERVKIEAGIKRFKLSPTEYAILLLISSGKTNREISQSLRISYYTIKGKHVYEIFQKMYVLNRIQAVVKALEEGLIPDHVLGSSLP